ncbi:MAG: hypothetical protein J3R72DRAFT_453299, partial [Linnemannia gamsii]
MTPMVQHSNVDLCNRMPLTRCFCQPLHCLPVVLWNAMTLCIQYSDFILRVCIPKLCRFDEPLHGLGVVLYNSPTAKVKNANASHCRWEPLIGRLECPLQRSRIILGNAVAIVVEVANGILCLREPLLYRFEVPSHRSGVVLCYSLAVEIKLPDSKLGVSVAFIDHLEVALQCLQKILSTALSLFLQQSQVDVGFNPAHDASSSWSGSLNWRKDRWSGCLNWRKDRWSGCLNWRKDRWSGDNMWRYGWRPSTPRSRWSRRSDDPALNVVCQRVRWCIYDNFHNSSVKSSNAKWEEVVTVGVFQEIQSARVVSNISSIYEHGADITPEHDLHPCGGVEVGSDEGCVGKGGSYSCVWGETIVVDRVDCLGSFLHLHSLFMSQVGEGCDSAV